MLYATKNGKSVCLPHTKEEFRRLGKRRLGGRSVEAAKRLHDQRKEAQRIRSDPLTFSLSERIKHKMVLVELGREDFYHEARQEFPQRKNWESPKPIKDRIAGGWRVRPINHGSYSRRCTFSRYTYAIDVRSCAYATPGFIIYWWADEAGKRIYAPKGYRWDIDHHGLRLVRGKDDYHPNSDDLRNLTPRQLAAKVRENATKRKQVAAESRRTKDAVRRAEAEGATVCLADSLRAGNCYAGTTSWARQHGLDPKQHYSPSKVLAMANGDAARVALVVTVALRRHRQEMERGFAKLSEHRV